MDARADGRTTSMIGAFWGHANAVQALISAGNYNNNTNYLANYITRQFPLEFLQLLLTLVIFLIQAASVIVLTV